MVFIRFHPGNTHTELCEYEQWNHAENAMGICGMPATGQRGNQQDSKIALCKEHFDWATALIHKSDDIKEEKISG